jgi:hypothetical protein
MSILFHENKNIYIQMHTCMDNHILWTENDLTKRPWKQGRLLKLKIENNGAVTRGGSSIDAPVFLGIPWWPVFQ